MSGEKGQVRIQQDPIEAGPLRGLLLAPLPNLRDGASYGTPVRPGTAPRLRRLQEGVLPWDIKAWPDGRLPDMSSDEGVTPRPHSLKGFT